MKSSISLGAILFLSLLLSCSKKLKQEHNSYRSLVETYDNRDFSKLQIEMKKLCQKKVMAACVVAEGKDRQYQHQLSILQGATNDNSTQVNVLLSESHKNRLSAHLWQGDKLIKKNLSFFSWYGHKGSDTIIADLKLNQLDNQEEYRLDFLLDNSKLLDVRYFRLLPPKPEKITVAIASCLDDSFDVQEKMWQGLLAQKPDLIFLIGDNVYADKGISGNYATPKDLWRRYTETRKKLHIYHTPLLKPIYAVWDDHDYGINNGGKDYLYSKESLSIFKSFFSLEEHKWYSKGPGASSFLTYAGQNFAFLDDRSFRDTNESPEGHHLGEKQRQWLWRNIQKNTKPTWLINGNQFFGAYHPFESFQGRHPQKFKSFLTKAAKLEVPLLFISGDRHLTEIMEIPKEHLGHRTYELTSSGMHAKVYPDSLKKNPSPWQIAGADGVYNYMLVHSKAKKNKLELEVKSFGPDEKLLYQKKLVVEK